MPPVVNNLTFSNATLSNPASGQTATTTGVRTIIASATDFKNPRTTQWNAGVTQRLANWMIAEVSYVGSHGDNLIRPTDINYPDPGAVVALNQTVPGAVNPVRPYRSYGASPTRYDGAIELPRLLPAQIDCRPHRPRDANYTLSRNQPMHNDRDAIDIRRPSNNNADYPTLARPPPIFMAASPTSAVLSAPAALRSGACGWHLPSPVISLPSSDAAHPGVERHVPARRVC